MKKAITLALSAMMLFTACGNTDKQETTNNNTTTEQTEGTDQTGDQSQELTEEEKQKAEEYIKTLASQGNDQFKQLQMPEEGETIAVIKTNMGDIKVRLFEEEAPLAVKNFKELAESGYYDGVIFHRVVEDFVIQGGDPTGTGTGGQSAYGQDFPDEFSPNLYNFNGALSMANRGPNTNGSQFFIVTCDDDQEEYFNSLNDVVEKYGRDQLLQNPNTGAILRTNYSEKAIQKYDEIGGTPNLDYVHTVFGQVFSGMDVAEKISEVEVDANDKPVKDVVIEDIVFEEYKK